MVKWVCNQVRVAGAIRLLVVFVLIPVVGAVLNAVINPNAPWRVVEKLAEGEINLNGVAQLQGPVLWLDARSEEEYLNGHVPGALNLSMERFDEDFFVVFEQWIPGQPVVVYCGSPACGLSSSVAELLRDDYQMGSVYVLKGGWEEWLAADGEVAP